MSELKKLLEGVKVEWKALSDVAEIGTGSRNTNEAKLDGKYPFFVRSQTPRLIDEYEFDETAIITAGDGVGVGKVFHYIVGKYALHQRAYRIVAKHKSLDSKYLFHYIKNNFAKYIEKVSVRASVTSLRKPMFEKFPIPIPCTENPEQSLRIQKEIVRVLDSLTEETNALTNELDKELKIRQKQYEYYLEELFKFENKEVEWKKISEIGSFQRGKRFVRTDMLSVGVPCIHYGEMYTHYGVWASTSKSFLNHELVSIKKLRVADKGDVVIVAAGETIEDIGKGTAWLGEDRVVIHDACFFYKSPLDPKYVAYFTRTAQFHDQIKKNISSGKISAINEKGFKSVTIPVPSSKESLDEQKHIVKILDELDSATQAIKVEIKKEITLRKKQYEYYRELLLTFPKEDS